MASAIRHGDGKLIDTNLYKAIRATGKALIENVLFKAIPKDRTSQNRPRTKTLFMDIYRDTWNMVVNQYEVEQPLLSLCSGHWKSEHMLSSILMSIENKKRNQAKKTKANGKSKAQGYSSSSADEDSEFGSPEHVDTAPVPDVRVPSGDSAPEVQVGGKQPRADSSTPGEQSGLQLLKRSKPSMNTGIFYDFPSRLP